MKLDCVVATRRRRVVSASIVLPGAIEADRMFGQKDLQRATYQRSHNLIYMLLKLPLSIIAFTITIAFSAATVALTLTPLAYLISVLLAQQGIVPDYVHLQIMFVTGHSFIEAHNYFEPVMLMRSFMLLLIGLLMGLLTRWLLAKMAYASGALARALLCFDNQTTTTMSANPK